MTNPTFLRDRTAIVCVFSAALLLLSLSASVRAAVAPAPRSVDLSSASGVNWEFQPENGSWQAIKVPAGGWRAQGLTCDAGSYRTVIDIPQDASGKEILLKFAAINFGADIWAGPDQARLTMLGTHVDGWVPVEVDATKVAQAGKPMAIRVDVRGRRKYMVNGKFTVPEGASWDPYLEEGILRGVSLEIVPKLRITDVFVQPNVGSRLISATVTVQNDSDIPQTVTINGAFASANHAATKYPAVPAMRAEVPAGQSAEVAIGPLKWVGGPSSLWWPNIPYKPGYRAQLHDLKLTLSAKGVSVEAVSNRFGYRSFAAVGNHYELNGVHVNLRGDNQQEADFGTDAYGVRPGFGPPSPNNAGWPQAVDNLERLNFTVMRIHQIPATPYMLDVCDELGLMLIEESPLRGSEGREDYDNGKDNMLNMDRELVRRDRNHPSVVIWSAANEWAAPIKDAYAAILAIDPTRVIIADGIGDLGAPYINIQHYTTGFGNGPATKGGTPRSDRPFGEGEAIWPADNTVQGFAWMATGIRIRRLEGNADIRNYTLNNAWSNYVPGESDGNEIIEKHVKGMGKPDTVQPAIAHPWDNPQIKLMQQCCSPVAVVDTDFDTINGYSDSEGDWPVSSSIVAPDAPVIRHLIVLNDDLSGSQIKVVWQARDGAVDGKVIGSGSFEIAVPVGTSAPHDIQFPGPKAGDTEFLTVAAYKDNILRFREDRISLKTPKEPLVDNGTYRLENAASHLYASAGTDGYVTQQAMAGDNSQIWKIANLGANRISILNVGSGKALDVENGGASGDGALVVVAAPSAQLTQVWHVDQIDDAHVQLRNVATAKLFDDYATSLKAGGKIVQWATNGGVNQDWMLVPTRK
jgi:hypothetical protein